MTIDSKYSRRTDFLYVAIAMSGLGLMSQGSGGSRAYGFRPVMALSRHEP
jgi:hypothetical protein